MQGEHLNVDENVSEKNMKKFANINEICTFILLTWNYIVKVYIFEIGIEI